MAHYHHLAHQGRPLPPDLLPEARNKTTRVGSDGRVAIRTSEALGAIAGAECARAAQRAAEGPYNVNGKPLSVAPEASSDCQSMHFAGASGQECTVDGSRAAIVAALAEAGYIVAGEPEAKAESAHDPPDRDLAVLVDEPTPEWLAEFMAELTARHGRSGPSSSRRPGTASGSVCTTYAARSSPWRWRTGALSRGSLTARDTSRAG